MVYDKPKVTIDLEEYNELITKKQSDPADEILLWKTALMSSLRNNRGDIKDFIYSLQRIDIELSIPYNLPRNVEPDDMTIKRIS